MGRRKDGRTTSWSAPKVRRIRGEDRTVQTRYVNGKEEVKIVEDDLKRERPGELDKQIPYARARKLFHRKAKSPAADISHRARHTFRRPNKRWEKNMDHYDVEQIDTPRDPVEHLKD